MRQPTPPPFATWLVRTLASERDRDGLLGDLIAWMRPRAAIALAVLAALMGIVSLVVTGDRAPLWYQIALILIGPAAALAGGRVLTRQKERSRL